MPQAAYIHVPFCRHHCGYCNFTVLAGRDDLIPSLVKALGTELATLGTPQPVTTLYLGGGTPSHLSPSQIESLLAHVAQWLPPTNGTEFTIEANPEDVDADRVGAWQRFGINRVSLGAQSFQPHKLWQLERTHSPNDIRRAVDAIRRAGPAVAVDLIFAVPGESLRDWQDDLRQVIELQPEHISTYGLTIEKGTPFWNRRWHHELREVDEELQREMYLTAIDRLTSAGYEHYEVSNFGWPGHRSRHNHVYWQGEPYFGFGPGAARYVAGRRETNHRSTTTYLRRIERGDSPTAETETLDAEQRARERLVLGLRLIEGIHLREFESATGTHVDALAGPQLDRFVQLGMLTRDAQRIRLTRDGLLISDSLWPDLL